MKPLVGVVIPVGGRIDPSEWMMAIRSVVDQDYPLDRIRVIQVIRVDDDNPTPIISTTKPESDLLTFDSASPSGPTTFEQIEIGYRRALNMGCEFVCVCSANDVMEPFKISDEVDALMEHPEAMVAYGDLVIWDHGDDSVFVNCGFNFDPAPGTSYANGLPDICMIRSSALCEIPFCGADGEACNDIMFFRIFEKYGRQAFVKTSRPNYIYRTHEQALSRNIPLHVHGKKRLVSFMNEYPPIKDRGLGVELSFACNPPQKTKDIVLRFVERNQEPVHVRS